MMEQVNVYWGYIVAAVIAIPFRYFLTQTQACQRIGRAISDTGSKTGFRDAVTPPASVKWALLTYISVVAIIGYQGWAFGFLAAGITLVVIFAVAAIAGRTLIPKPDAMSWNLRIYASLGARVADYRRDGDQMRADAAEDLMQRIETRLLAPPNVGDEGHQDDPGDPEILAFAEAVRKLQRHHTDSMDDLFEAVHSFGWQPNNRESEESREGFSFTLRPLSFNGYASSSNNPAPGGFGRTIMITGSGDYEGLALFVQDFIQVLLGDPQQQNVTDQARHLARQLLKEEDFFSVEKIRQLRNSR